ncbi:WVD2-like protein 7 [Tanacetum coccineum]|uniref:WVD2-like protein 7 n=1 Tax=Tanacetum coccineum TaxID=301880 RepID=A0ABQ5AVQ3_9ASTR
MKAIADLQCYYEEIKVSNSALVSAFMTEMEADSPVTKSNMSTEQEGFTTEISRKTATPVLQKLEDAQKVQLQTTLKEKSETELTRLRQSCCFKARPLPSFYNERETPKSPLKKVTNVISKKPMATPSKKFEEKFKEKDAQKVQLQTTLKEKPETTELRRLRQSFCFKARPLPTVTLERTPQANQKSLTPARKTPTTFSQPLSVKKSSRRLWKTSDQNPDHPLSKYAALIDSEDTHYPMYIISQPYSVKKSSRRLWKTSDQNPADHPLSKYATLIDSEDTHYPNY